MAQVGAAQTSRAITPPIKARLSPSEVGNAAGTPRSATPGKTPSSVLRVTAALAALFLSAGLPAAEPLQAEIDFQSVYGIPVVELATSEGKLRLVVDTASNFTSLLRGPKRLRVRLAGQEILLHPVPIQTREFAGFNAAVSSTDQVDGLLGEDFFRQFESVRFDFPRHKILLVLNPPKAHAKVNRRRD